MRPDGHISRAEISLPVEFSRLSSECDIGLPVITDNIRSSTDSPPDASNRSVFLRRENLTREIPR